MNRLLKSKNTIFFAFVLCICGVVLMFADKITALNTSKNTDKIESNKTAVNNEKNVTEERLENILSSVKGVGEVRVMIEYSEGEELIVAQDNTIENNSASGNTQSRTEDKVVLSKDEPIILKKINPKIQGVLIVAQGVENVDIKNQIIEATMSLLGVEMNKIEVLTMK